MNLAALPWGLYFSATPVVPRVPDEPAPSPPQLEPAASPPKGPNWTTGVLLILAGGVIGTIAWNATQRDPAAAPTTSVAAVPTAPATIGTFENTIRIGGTIGAKRFGAIRAPRLRGSGDTGQRSLTLMNMAEGGTIVKAGDVVSEFEMRWLVDHVDDRQSAVVQTRSDVEKRRAEVMNRAGNASAIRQSRRSRKGKGKAGSAHCGSALRNRSRHSGTGRFRKPRLPRPSSSRKPKFKRSPIKPICAAWRFWSRRTAITWKGTSVTWNA